MAQVTTAGQKFTAYGMELTVKCFFGDTGIEYSTAAEAREGNPGAKDDDICVTNMEYENGTTPLSASILKQD